MSRIHDSVISTIGNTPMVRLNRITEGAYAEVIVKLEYFNPASSVKDRIACAMIDEAEKSGELQPGGLIVEPTSGNTGIGLAMNSAARGYRLVLTMPDSMSFERRALLKFFGAELVLTPAIDGMRGAIEKAAEIVAQTPGAFMPQQFMNKANPAIHERTTGPEIWADTDGGVDIFVAGVGTGGTASGVGRYLKKMKSSVEVVAVEPETSAVISGKVAGRHAIQGIGAGFVPENLDRSVIDRIATVSNDSAIEMSRRLAREEGILAGISSGGNVHVAVELARLKKNSGKIIVCLACDTGERYLSTPLFDDLRQ